MKKFILFLIVILLIALDNTLMPFFSIRHVFPSLTLSFIISYSIINGTWEGLYLGIFSGALQDLYLFNGFGVNALANMLVCLMAAKIGENIFKEKKLIPVISSFILSLVKGIAVYIILYLVGVKFDIANVFYLSLYNMVVTLFMYKRVYKLCQKNYMKKDWNF